MKFAIPLAAALTLFAASAVAAPIAPIRATDLNGVDHQAPADWREGGVVIIMGFSHDARESMDRWAEALGFDVSAANWLEIPVIGTDAPPFARPMIRSGMRARYDTEARRAHVAPVFDNADAFRALAGLHQSDVVVLVLNPAGEVAARFEDAISPAEIDAARRALGGR
jgi:hypothetical protein